MNKYSAPQLIGLTVEKGSLVKPFEADSKNKFFQCIADTESDSIRIIPSAKEGVKITVDGKEIKSGEKATIKLTEKRYGYVTAEIKLTSQENASETSFILAVLKPAPDKKTLYSSENRPQFHYTAPYGYINDPNGMLYNAAAGEYHLFYQSYPYSQFSKGKHWGHASTTDLVTFKEHTTTLYPDNNGEMWSGCGIIDYNNVSGLYDETTPPNARMLLFYYPWTMENPSAGLAYTPDGGKNWIKAENGRLFNFIGTHPGHVDPKVFWWEERNKWVMFCATGDIFTSENLWDWTHKGKDRHSECPDIYKIKVEGTDNFKFVRSYGGTFYRIGDLKEKDDGTIEFIAETDFLPCNGESLDRYNKSVENILKECGWFSGKTGTFYATQHYAEAPNNRIINVSWLIERGLDNSEIWAGAMTVATEQKLYKKKGGGYILHSFPVKEIDSLRGDLIYSGENITVTPESENILEQIFATFADINGTFTLDENVTEFGFKLRKGSDNGDITVKYDTVNEVLIADYSNSKHNTYNGVRTMEMELPEDRTVSLKILLDNIIVESFGNNGEAAISSVFCRNETFEGMEFFTVSGNVTVKNLNIYKMNSIWK